MWLCYAAAVYNTKSVYGLYRHSSHFEFGIPLILPIHCMYYTCTVKYSNKDFKAYNCTYTLLVGEHGSNNNNIYSILIKSLDCMLYKHALGG